ncbi:hypothetical protein THAOC_37593, partial [Thalassiosira oceanica]
MTRPGRCTNDDVLPASWLAEPMSSFFTFGTPDECCAQDAFAGRPCGVDDCRDGGGGGGESDPTGITYPPSHRCRGRMWHPDLTSPTPACTNTVTDYPGEWDGPLMVGVTMFAASSDCCDTLWGDWKNKKEEKRMRCRAVEAAECSDPDPPGTDAGGGARRSRPPPVLRAGSAIALAPLRDGRGARTARPGRTPGSGRGGSSTGATASAAGGTTGTPSMTWESARGWTTAAGGRPRGSSQGRGRRRRRRQQRRRRRRRPLRPPPLPRRGPCSATGAGAAWKRRARCAGRGPGGSSARGGPGAPGTTHLKPARRTAAAMPARSTTPPPRGARRRPTRSSARRGPGAPGTSPREPAGRTAARTPGPALPTAPPPCRADRSSARRGARAPRSAAGTSPWA